MTAYVLTFGLCAAIVLAAILLARHNHKEATCPNCHTTPTQGMS